MVFTGDIRPSSRVSQKKTRNPKIARDAGRYVTSSKAYRVIREYIYGFIGPEKAYNLLPKINTKVSRGSRLTVRKLSHCRIEAITTPLPDVRRISISVKTA